MYVVASSSYDMMLTIQYGDYMTPPPKDKQVPIHTYTAYRLPAGVSYDDFYHQHSMFSRNIHRE